MILGLALLVLFLLVNVYLVATGKFTDGETGERLATLEILGIMVAAGLTLAMYSFLYKDNPLFKFAEHLFLGISVGYTITITVHQYLAKQVYTPLIEPLLFPDRTDLTPRWILLIPVALGICLLARFIPRIAWLSRYAFAMMVGWAAGLMVPQVVLGYLYKQAQATLTPFNSSPSFWANVSTVVVFFGVLSVLVYFFFSVKQDGPLKHISNIGMIYLMISFGATFGFTVMSRISLLTGRAMFLFRDWLHLMDR